MQSDPNLYPYVGNDPLNATDSAGEEGEWKPSDCPKTCKEHYNGPNQSVLDDLARKLKSGGGDVDVVFGDCGGEGFSLRCGCPIGKKRKGKAIIKSVVCINTTSGDTCSAIQALEHEFEHIHGRGERFAYTVSCKIQAQQECRVPDSKCPSDDPARREYQA